jgi:voltage-gated potassium channel Kch
MRLIAILSGVVLIASILRDAFETVILPRTVVRFFSLSRVINGMVWPFWSRRTARSRNDARRERYLSFYGPLTVIVMLAVWAGALIFGFALILYGFGSPLHSDQRHITFVDDVYASGTTLFTLGLGDVVPTSMVARVLMVIEAGSGLGFLTVGIAYLPVVYQAFSRREAQITLLDAWAGSPPAATELLRRLAAADSVPELSRYFHEWERWCGELLEAQISYPQLAYFRSQHGRQSWVSALTTALDVSALALTGIEGVPVWNARLTFAIARHAAVDLSQVIPAPAIESTRLRQISNESIIATVQQAGFRFTKGPGAAAQLQVYREMYEPFVAGLSSALAMDLPPWMRNTKYKDNWETTPRKDTEKHL